MCDRILATLFSELTTQPSMENPFQKSLRAGLHAHTMQAYECGHYIMVKNIPHKDTEKPSLGQVPKPAHCDITELRLMSGSCEGEECRTALKMQVISSRIVELMVEAENDLGSAMMEYIKAKTL
jgi:hypothetical protein